MNWAPPPLPSLCSGARAACGLCCVWLLGCESPNFFQQKGKRLLLALHTWSDPGARVCVSWRDNCVTIVRHHPDLIWLKVCSEYGAADRYGSSFYLISWVRNMRGCNTVQHIFVTDSSLYFGRIGPVAKQSRSLLQHSFGVRIAAFR